MNKFCTRLVVFTVWFASSNSFSLAFGFGNIFFSKSGVVKTCGSGATGSCFGGLLRGQMKTELLVAEASAEAIKPKRLRGIGSRLQHVSTNKELIESALQSLSTNKQLRGIGSRLQPVTTKKESVGSALQTVSASNETKESESLIKKLHKKSKSPLASKTKQIATPEKIRTATEFSVQDYSAESKREMEDIFLGRKSKPLSSEATMRELLRRSTSKLEFMKSSDILINPGALEVEQTILSGLSGVPLTELNRRGLLPPPPPAPQELQRGRSAVKHDVKTNFSIFKLTLVGSELLCGGSDSDITIFDIKSWTAIGTLVGHKGWVNDIVADPRQAGRVYSVSDDGTARLWDVATRECLVVYKGLGGPAHAVVAVGKELVVTGQSAICVFKAEDGSLIRKLTGHARVLRAMSGGKQMSKSVQIDERSVQERLPATLFGLRVGGVAVHEPYLLTAVDDGTVWVWNRAAKTLARKIFARDARPGTWVRPLLVRAVPDSSGKSQPKLISGWSDGAVRIFDLKTWELERTLPGHNGPVLTLQFVGGRLLSGGADMVALEWDPAFWTISRRFTDHRGAVCASAGLPDGLDGQSSGSGIVTASLDGYIKVWNAS